MIQRHTAAECLRSPLAEQLPTRCQQLKKGFGECKRGMVDMRKRFRGNQTITVRQLESTDDGDGYQLYAGKSAFGGASHTTDGNEKAPADWREVENQKYQAELAALLNKK
jgi:cytochrome c oxidase assembly factor 5